VILVTCATPDENKDELCADLASSFAQAGKRVLLIESDRRYPALRGNGGLPADGHPSDILTTKDVHKSVVKHPRVPGLFVLACGSSVHNPSALLDLQLMQQFLEEWRTAFDFIVINAPPVIRFGDARFLSEMADATVQLARYGSATRASLKRAHVLLSTYATGNVGIVFTGVPNDSNAT
jgi:polysaccharide biosynthesis transport protein